MPADDLARTVEGPTYHAIHPLTPGVTLTFGGITAHARVQEADRRTISSL